jgi:hypothetical protein
MIGNRVAALAVAASMALSPSLGFAQEETGGAAEGGIETPFGKLGPEEALLAGAIAAGAIAGIVVAVTAGGGGGTTTTNGGGD